MDRPEDIPQWAWNEAGEVMRSSPFAMAASDYFDETADLIARALIKAREEAFEEAAKIAETHRATMSLWLSSEWPTAKQATAYATENIAQAIRQHSQKGER